MPETYQGLLDELVSQEIFKKADPLYSAFEKVDRADFVRPQDKNRAYLNTPVIIGGTSTISQPYTVAFMLQLLDVHEGSKILEIGYGSGWQTSILSKLVGRSGQVFATEIDPNLKEFGEQNISRYTEGNVETFLAVKGQLGLSDYTPFDRIIVGASASALHPELLGQLCVEGILVSPIKDSIVKIVKTPGGENKTEEYPGFTFVPLVE